jgi:hypothetical protein
LGEEGGEVGKGDDGKSGKGEGGRERLLRVGRGKVTRKWLRCRESKGEKRMEWDERMLRRRI